MHQPTVSFLNIYAPLFHTPAHPYAHLVHVDPFPTQPLPCFQQERYKLDMDEGPERTRLHLRPNHDFYDTYEVLAPALSPSSSAAATAAAGTTAVKKAALSSTALELLSNPVVLATTATTTAAEIAAAAAAAAPLAVAVVPADAGGAAAASAADPEEKAEAATAAAGVSAEAATAAVVAAAVETSFSPQIGGVVGDLEPPMLSLMLPGNSSTGSNGDGADGDGDGEGGQVARIAALVKTMSASVGVGGQEGARGKKPLTSVFDLDDTDCSALLELEELRLEDAPEGGGGEGVRGGEKERHRSKKRLLCCSCRLPSVEQRKVSPVLAASREFSNPEGTSCLELESFAPLVAHPPEH